MNDDEAAVRDALVQLDAAFAHGDPQAIIDLCTEDVVSSGQVRVRRQWDRMA